MKLKHRISALILAMIMAALLIVPAFAAVISKRHSGIYIGDVTFYIYDSAYSKPYYSYTRPGSVDVSIFRVNDEITYCLEPFQPSEVDAQYQESGFPSYMAGRDTAILRAICYGAPANGHDSDEARVATQLLIWDISMGYADGQWNWISPDGAKPPFYAAAESLLPDVKAEYDTIVAALKANSGLPTGITLSDLHVWDDDGTYDPRLQTMVSVNLPMYGKLNLRKISSDTAISGGNSNYSLSGAVYGVYTSRNNATSDINRIATLTTGADGVSNTVENLDPGTYWVRELTAPKGFALNTTPVSVTVEVNKTAQVTMSDNPQTDPVGILLKKVDSATNGAPASSELSLEGAEFTIKFYGGNYTTASAAESSGTLKRTWVIKSNSNGYCELAQQNKISGDDFYLTSGGVPTLPLGTVVIQETKAPAGYQINSQKYVVQITSGGVSTETVNTYNAPTVSENVITGTVQLTKTSEDGRVSGIGFTISGPNGYSTTVETDAAGTFALTNLYPGTYTITEDVPRGYDPQESQTMTIAPGETGTVSFHNKLSRADIRVIKVDGETNESLAGAGFRLFDVSGAVIGEGVTDENGVLTFENLILGEYSYQEYQAPKGFVLDETVYPVTLDTGDTTVTHTHENTPRTGSISIHKVNASGIVMPGTKVMLQASEDNGATWTDVSCKTTDKNGDATWTDLPVRGFRYRIIEVEAKPGSSLMTKPIWEGTLPIKINEDNVPEGADAEIIDGYAYLYDLHVTAINTPTMVLPFTGSNTMLIYMSLAMLAAFAGINFMKKSKEEIYE